MNVVVTGVGLVSALGSLETTWKRLLAKQSGIRLHQPFSDLRAKPLALIAQQPATLDTLIQTVVTAALQDAGLGVPLPNCGVVIGSSRGKQGEWERLAREWGKRGLGRWGDGEMGRWGDEGDEGDEGVGEAGEAGGGARSFQSAICNLQSAISSPPSWLHTLPHAAAIATAQLIGTQVAVRAPMAACATGLWAIAQGYELIRIGECDRVLAGAVESPISPLTLVGFEKMGALAETGAYPFDRDREGLVLGEGGAVLVLESEAVAKARSAPIYGRILGFGLTADGYHVSAPEPGRGAAITAVQHCLSRSGLVASDIDYIHAHGTATQLNDRNEAQLIQQLFPQDVPVSSTKGTTGHTLGASGALGVAFCLLALKHQLLPPTVGLQQPEFDLNFVRSTQPATLQHALCLSFGFGGQNGAIALAK